jgi:hypothetical protein
MTLIKKGFFSSHRQNGLISNHLLRSSLLLLLLPLQQQYCRNLLPFPSHAMPCHATPTEPSSPAPRPTGPKSAPAGSSAPSLPPVHPPACPLHRTVRTNITHNHYHRLLLPHRDPHDCAPKRGVPALTISFLVDLLIALSDRGCEMGGPQEKCLLKVNTVSSPDYCNPVLKSLLVLLTQPAAATAAALLYPPSSPPPPLGAQSIAGNVVCSPLSLPKREPSLDSYVTSLGRRSSTVRVTDPPFVFAF